MKENFINYLPLKIYRYLRWKKSVNREYRFIRDNFSEEYAQLCLEAVKASRQNRSTEDVLSAYAKKDAYILRYLENLCSDVIDAYKNREHLKTVQGDKKRIWVFWWTGEATAPDIVRACIKSIRDHAGGYDVVVLDQTNYLEYVNLPDYILEKHDQKIISHAHFSDIVRLSLLAKYGGVWIDATVYISQTIPDCVFTNRFYTLKTEDPTAPYYSKSKWCGYFLAGDGEFELFAFAKDLLLEYWKKQSCVIDYLLMDYMFGIACKYSQDINNTVSSLPDNNINRGELMRAINEPYSPELFARLASQDTFASKLSWRYGNPRPYTKDGKLSNYGYILKR